MRGECRSLKAKTVGKPIRLVRHTNDVHELTKHRVRHASFAGKGGMASDAIVATIGYADGEVDPFLHQTVQGTGGQHRLLGFPCTFQEFRSPARYFQKLLTSATFRSALISPKMARTSADASVYSTDCGLLI